MDSGTKKVLLWCVAICVGFLLLSVALIMLEGNWVLRERAKAYLPLLVIGVMVFLCRRAFFGPSEARFVRSKDASGSAVFRVTPARLSLRTNVLYPGLVLGAVWLWGNFERPGSDEAAFVRGLFWFLFVVFCPIWIVNYFKSRGRRRVTLTVGPEGLSEGRSLYPYQDIAEIGIGSGSGNDQIVFSTSLAENMGRNARERDRQRNHSLYVRLRSGSRRIALARGLTDDCAEALASDLVEQMQENGGMARTV